MFVCVVQTNNETNWWNCLSSSRFQGNMFVRVVQTNNETNWWNFLGHVTPVSTRRVQVQNPELF
jgi:hypothetical protein